MRQHRIRGIGAGRFPAAAAHALAMIGVLLLLLAAACSKRESAAPISLEPQAARQAPAAAPAPPAEEARAKEGESERVFERKLVKDAELEIEVASYAEARRLVDQRLAAVKGYVADATVSHKEGEVSSASLVLRVPADALASFMRDCAALGTVRNEKLHTRDISEEYYDAEARLTNARKLEARLLDIVGTKADNVKDLLEVERELARVREQIETTQGKLKLFDSQVAYSKLMLHLTTRQRFEGGKPKTFAEQLAHTFGESLRALGKAARGGALVVVALVPWLLPLGVLAALAYYLLSFIARRDRERARARAARTAVTAPLAGTPGAGSPAAVSAEPWAAPVAPTDRPGQSDEPG